MNARQRRWQKRHPRPRTLLRVQIPAGDLAQAKAAVASLVERIRQGTLVSGSFLSDWYAAAASRTTAEMTLNWMVRK